MSTLTTKGTKFEFQIQDTSGTAVLEIVCVWCVLNSPKQSEYKLSPLDRYYHVSSLYHPISKSSTNFVHNLSLFGNELIKHNSREELDAIHEMKIRVLHKVYKQVFK
jgi:hypothetical protein